MASYGASGRYIRVWNITGGEGSAGHNYKIYNAWGTCIYDSGNTGWHPGSADFGPYDPGYYYLYFQFWTFWGGWQWENNGSEVQLSYGATSAISGTWGGTLNFSGSGWSSGQGISNSHLQVRRLNDDSYHYWTGFTGGNDKSSTLTGRGAGRYEVHFSCHDARGDNFSYSSVYELYPIPPAPNNPRTVETNWPFTFNYTYSSGTVQRYNTTVSWDGAVKASANNTNGSWNPSLVVNKIVVYSANQENYTGAGPWASVTTHTFRSPYRLSNVLKRAYNFQKRASGAQGMM
ncbi:hypothetical protein J7643_19180 [bacterium]|nr:hypothetical protein [bacterium]